MVTLINPNLVVLRNDPFTTGIVYMPIGLAYLAASLQKANMPVRVVDAFGESPYKARCYKEFMFLGLTNDEVVERISDDASIVFVYAINLTNHISTISIIKSIKKVRPKLKIIVCENTQAVTAYALSYVADEFYRTGADYVLTGESEYRAVCIAQILLNDSKENSLRQIDGVGGATFYDKPIEMIDDLDSLPFPAWDMFPIENYWRLRFAHGPQTSKRYLPLLTSRGCPYKCRFCVTPANNNQRWRPRSAKNVVDEIEYFYNKYKVQEFHFEDLNPTVSDRRTREICNEILKRSLNINWKIASGTKIEAIKSEETVDLMARAGCRYISISPETGSTRLLKQMHKPFNLDHAIKMIKRMNYAGIRSQACFILGYPGENEEDLKMTRDMVKDITRKGVDEIALFIITPVPGSAIYEEIKGYKSLSELNFSPVWRHDYRLLNRFRFRLYFSFLIWKLWYHPLKVIGQPINFLQLRFETKMEMVPYRAIVFKILDWFTLWSYFITRKA